MARIEAIFMEFRGPKALVNLHGCPVLHRMRGPSAVRHSCATLNPDQPNARSPERAQRPCVFFLTLTYMDVGKPTTESADGTPRVTRKGRAFLVNLTPNRPTSGWRVIREKLSSRFKSPAKLQKQRVSNLRFPHLSNRAATARTEFKILFPAVCSCAKSRLTFANTIGERTNVVRVSTLTESLCSREEIQPLQVLGGAFYVRFSELLAGGGIGYRSPCLCQCSQCADLELASHDRQWQRTSGSNQWQRHFCCHLYSVFRRSSGFCEHRWWLAGTHYSHVSHRTGQHSCRTQWRCISGVEFPHYQHVHTRRSPGCLLPRWTLGKYGDPFDQCLWKRLQPWFAQYRVRRIRPGNRGVGADHQS